MGGGDLLASADVMRLIGYQFISAVHSLAGQAPPELRELASAARQSAVGTFADVGSGLDNLISGLRDTCRCEDCTVL